MPAIFDFLVGVAIGLKAADTVSQMAAKGNVADTGITQKVSEIQSAEVLKGNPRPDRCEVLQQLIDSGQISALQAKATQKAWGCRQSRASKDNCDK